MARIYLVFLAFVLSNCGTQPRAEADIVLSNGKVYTINPSQSWAEAVAIKGNEIIYVGSSSDAMAYAGADTEVTDLAGKMVLPGFVDAHIHPLGGVLLTEGVDLQTDNTDEIFERLKGYIQENPDVEVIRGFGVRYNPWNGQWPTAAMLDEVEAEKPIILINVDGHGGWANSKALEIAGVTGNTPEPAPGFSYFERDSEGNPTGWLVEVPAFLQVLGALVDLNDQEKLKRDLEKLMGDLAAAGITTFQDLGMGPLPGFEVYSSLEKEGKLTARIQGVYYWNDKAVDPIPLLQDLASKYNSDMVRANRLKVNMDGGDDKYNALYVEPYSDRPDVEMQPIIPYDIIDDAVRRADSLQFDISCHCFGDLAVRKMLDAYEKAINANPSWDRRHVVNHGVLIHPDDYTRFRELGVAYETTPVWGTLDPLMQSITSKRLGEARMQSSVPIKKIYESGGLVAFGSDWPAAGYISEYRPLMSIQVATTRQLPGREAFPPLGGEQAKIPLELALQMQTLNAAKAIGMDDRVGSIEVGKMADLVILEKNLFDINPSNIGKTRIAATMMNGGYTYTSD